jgi:peptide/nickel transport system ATP-binding protein
MAPQIPAGPVPPLLEVRGMRTAFGDIAVVDGVSLSVAPGRILGLVGESGSGKSITAFSILGLVEPPGRITDGEVLYKGRDLTRLSDHEMRKFRGNRIAMIFQDPMMTLNPVLRVGTQIVETILAHEKVPQLIAIDRAVEALSMVGIPAAKERMRDYPHQFSGGMRQRVAIAIAILHRPELIIADEPTTALDVTIQAQILAEVQRLARETGTALIWITHDLSVVAGLADDIAVMYCGKIVEQGSTDDVLDSPAHPYTKGLIESVPTRNRRGARLHQIPGSTPNPAQRPSGCQFRLRCPNVLPICEQTPPQIAIGPGHWARCFNPVASSINKALAP